MVNAYGIMQLQNTGVIYLVLVCGFIHLFSENSIAEQGEVLLKADIMAVFAHPDDETGMATTLAHYALLDHKKIVNVYCTRGEGGGNMVGRHWGPALGLLRESELQNCLSILGIKRFHFLDQRDWAYTESAQMTLESWDRKQALESLVRLIRASRPEILLTMNPTPNPGQHGHHQAAGILTIEAFNLASNPQAFPHQIEEEGLELWQVKKLYIGNSPEPYGALIKSTAILPSGKSISKIAGEALSHHRSQGFGRMANAPWMARPRTYQLLKSTVGFVENEESLFRGLSNPKEDALHQVASIPFQTPNNQYRFINRPAIERFNTWVNNQGVQVLTSQRSSQLSLPYHFTSKVFLKYEGSGEPSWDSLEFKSNNYNSMVVKPQFDKASPNLLPIDLSINSPSYNNESLQVIKNGNPITNLSITTLPHIKIKKSVHLESQFWPEWGQASQLSISHRQTWQGESQGAEDIAGKSFIAWSEKFLFIRTEVTDDNVVTNIFPNDARGHWRSDSIEICIDPGIGSEHTLNCFKAGIFPFTIGGGVAGSRDADANQGPLEKTAPGMVLQSGKSSSGYWIQSAIPWKLTTISPIENVSFGFNLLIYDGDKENPEPGENIGQTRLAWSPNRGIQGRPEDWGLITLISE